MNAQEIAASLRALALPERLSWIGQHFNSAVFSTSFGKEDQAITHAIAEAKSSIRVFTLDTGRLFEETLAVFATTRDRYGLAIDTYVPDSVALQSFVTSRGPNAFYDSVESRLECCRIRKVEPLGRALLGADVWVTGLRRGQSGNRADLPLVEWDNDHNLFKIHPVLDWEDEQLEVYIGKNGIPVNRLHAKGFPSIGCAPCTRAVAPGQDPRAGRWWWEDATKRECGLHLHRGESA